MNDKYMLLYYYTYYYGTTVVHGPHGLSCMLLHARLKPKGDCGQKRYAGKFLMTYNKARFVLVTYGDGKRKQHRLHDGDRDTKQLHVQWAC
eukprot:scaffold45236_cov29-Prasinocladus_malaysianus.AAC.1